MRNPTSIFLLSFISFLIGVAEYVVAGILDQISRDLQLPIPIVGQLITVFSIAFAIGTPIVITLTARMDRKRLLAGSMLVFAFANLIMLALGGYGPLNFARALSGLSGGVMEVLLLTLAARLAPEGKKAGAIAMVVMGFSAALVIGVPLGRVVAAWMNWRLVFAGLGLLTLAALIPVARLLPHTQGEAGMPLHQQLGLILRPHIMTVYAMTFFWISAFSIMYSYISPYLATVTGMTVGQISLMLLACGLASIAGSQLGGRYTDRAGDARTLFVGFTAHGLTLALCFLAGHVAWAMYALLLAWSITAWSSGPALQFRLISLTPRSTSIIFSFYTSMIQLGMAAGAIAGAMVIQAGSLALLPAVGAASLLVSLLLLPLVGGVGRCAPCTPRL
ncbi:MFS transporter [Bordetella trematum]|uniref:Sugar efflux transporter n=1 Tax=Bordetella trematum TaxID=123899 RepID=A0A157SJN2_9BORD|nr:MFS transporter [Bordetella trematum]AZR93294.1 MFS transporter [Bordetella trematum]NNH20585.1 MFS transporter [Bordetella trematum]SAI20456.1 sugar efflux transporter [Bordetella trematum]SAI70669.1 sugar efflux transporter [Bordetella trematum]SUV98670.1 sugar efflux transporter [Bordetella trematum]